jgi:hypothetical protein
MNLNLNNICYIYRHIGVDFLFTGILFPIYDFKIENFKY